MGSRHHLRHLPRQVYAGHHRGLRKNLMVLIEKFWAHHCHVVVDPAVRRTASRTDLCDHSPRKFPLLRVFPGQAIICHKLFFFTVQKLRAVPQQRSRNYLSLDLGRVNKSAGLKLLELHINQVRASPIGHRVAVAHNRPRIGGDSLHSPTPASGKNDRLGDIADRCSLPQIHGDST
ncbi:hypothetical protein SDC9_203836 [bioreactor metagenome]|uniref:Uncharacterized protein n=1 Tax=bioreactor metagenome TaxID=1076179 RepID=A0A645IZ26_9ZZZZ